MFVRKKKNRSGSTSVVVVDKRGGCFREVKTIGVSSEGKEIAELERILKISGIRWSVYQVLSIAKTVTTLKIKLPVSGETLTKTMIITPKTKINCSVF
jgi:hypothetical protein